MIRRNISQKLISLSKQVPVVTIIGPRQSGKTTLVKKCFPEYNYVNLEDPINRMLAKEDYKGFFETYKEPLIIDEVQRVPELLSAIQVMVDENREENGRFILTGSHQPSLQKGIAQSLAGRTSIMTLLPLSMNELIQEGLLEDLSTDELLLKGFMPELYKEGSREPSIYYRDYLNTYVEKDLREMLEIKNLDRFLRFLTLLAGRVGQVVNLSTLSGEVGVSSTTLSEWLSVLEASYIIYRLRPYFSNVTKQQIKSPKLYFTEVGLAAYLLGIETENQVNRDPLRGNLFENLIVTEVLKSRLNDNKDPNIYFMRTAKGVEVDLIVKKEDNLYPFEIKTSMTPNKTFAKHLLSFVEAEENAKNPRIIYGGDSYPKFNGAEYVNFRELDKYLEL
ncbi:ATP-binding protein [Facklamia sp. DSM 111018]|uniref:ATP-binding protein n=1 Tax=Facklamia lactis TaxID=2749967 RepID=A0ABS0LNR1_9LACT|nr:ATP-binding protein [Facklamia lactis]MBG9979535.1 ATP-binding protein [Facklamia lactis]MBG9985796.1 ATP-binding protein [Facklamia lactis]